MSEDINEIVIKDPYGFIYITTNMINGKRYLGQKRFDKKKKWKNYLGSGSAFKKSVEKYGRENFVRNIIDIAFSQEELNQKEYDYSLYFNIVESRDWYNLVYGDGSISGYHMSDETKKKMSNTKKGEKTYNKNQKNENHKMASDKCKPINKNDPWSGRHLSEETKRKISQANQGRVASEYTKKKMSESHKGDKNPNYEKTFSKETREKMSKAAKKRLENQENHPMYGKHHSEEVKQKIQENRTKPIGIKHFASKQVLCIETGIFYESITEASKSTGIRRSYIRETCNNIRENAKGYHFKFISIEEYNQLNKKGLDINGYST